MGLFGSLFGKKKKSQAPQAVEAEKAKEIEEITTNESVVTQEKVSTVAKKEVKTSATVKEAKASPAEKEVKASVAPTPATKIEDDIESADQLNNSATAETEKPKGYGGAFEIKKSKDGRFVFNLYASNKVIIATSQIYSSSKSAITGINSVIANAEKAAIEDQTLKNFTPQPFPKWEIYIDKGSQFRFRLCATNGSCVCHSQGYTQKSNCKKGIESVIRTVKNAKIDKSYLTKQ